MRGPCEMGRKEFADALLGIVAWPPRRPVNEADVPPTAGEFNCQARILPRELRNFIEDGRGQEGIVPGTQQQRWSVNARQESQRARSRVVVVCVAETVNRARDDVVELVECACSPQGNRIEEVRISAELCLSLTPQGAKKVALVHAGKATRDVARPTLEIEGNRDRGRGLDALGNGTLP